MIIKRSPLDLAEFVLIDQQYKFIEAEGEALGRSLFDQYNIDVDFSINTPDNLHFQIMLKIEVNPEQKLPGYFLASTGVGFFDFSSTPELSKQEKRDFLQISGISICINQLRSVMATLTANAPYGRYLLPSIDVNDLLGQKAASLQGREEKKSRKGK